MWKKIALVQLILLVALIAFWVGSETRAAVEPAQREFVTSNEEGNIVYLWSYNSAEKEWDVAALNFQKGAIQETTISTRVRMN
ncbi:MAG: hypothetical protein C4520_13645 [Candidatus Abyssobacteria bacterium SURF_5]|jgi:hypothetical protein|uniref:Uncharacterized protein n=1 Tax=Abyssobacteria bacterium (strain SURF_5) TaxID=2093360 RepID=A0A3A4NL96_ABYX5|nr:MAG: hypothetical protein C4520_13645 [Candidatus Abyssubacteria bacterium SURF_5]